MLIINTMWDFCMFVLLHSGVASDIQDIIALAPLFFLIDQRFFERKPPFLFIIKEKFFNNLHSLELANHAQYVVMYLHLLV